jgi:hypothetical protein
MATITFDTLKLARKLEAAGFPQRQAADTAEALAQSLGDVSDLATKADFAELRAELKADMTELRAELKADIAGLRAEIRGELNTHLRWIVGTIIGVAALAVAASKLLA